MQTFQCSHSGSSAGSRLLSIMAVLQSTRQVNAGVVRSVEDIIVVLADQRRERAQCILAAALAVRDARGRDRKDTLRKLAAS